jgi:hypothetical protein
LPAWPPCSAMVVYCAQSIPALGPESNLSDVAVLGATLDEAGPACMYVLGSLLDKADKATACAPVDPSCPDAPLESCCSPSMASTPLSPQPRTSTPTTPPAGPSPCAGRVLFPCGQKEASDDCEEDATSFSSPPARSLAPSWFPAALHPDDDSGAGTGSLQRASEHGPRSYKDALLSNISSHRSPTQTRLVFSPVRGRRLCYWCLSPEHCVLGCRDPLRCAACGRVGHRRRTCELPPLTYCRSAPAFPLFQTIFYPRRPGCVCPASVRPRHRPLGASQPRFPAPLSALQRPTLGVWRLRTRRPPTRIA